MQRLYVWRRAAIAPSDRIVWVHAASLGEFEQGRPLIEMLKRRHPEKKILLTFFSPSGYEVCKNYQLADVICYLPFDCPSNVRRFLDAVDVETAIFVKYEFWGNYLQELRRRNIPTYIISAIFRPTQAFFKGYGGMFRKMLKCYTHLFVQDKDSKDLLATIGVTNVEVFGDTRFDRVSDILDNKVDLPIVETFARGSFTVIAGSSWEPDEEFLISFFNRTPSMKLVLAPHELSEARVEGILSKLKRPAVRYSKTTVEEAADAEKVISLNAQFGEGWQLPADIMAYARQGINNVVSLQPFGCIANHIVSKGIEKRIKTLLPEMNILSLDFDSGVSDVNITNRLLLFIDSLCTRREYKPRAAI